MAANNTNGFNLIMDAFLAVQTNLFWDGTNVKLTLGRISGSGEVKAGSLSNQWQLNLTGSLSSSGEILVRLCEQATLFKLAAGQLKIKAFISKFGENLCH